MWALSPLSRGHHRHGRRARPVLCLEPIKDTSKCLMEKKASYREQD